MSKVIVVGGGPAGMMAAIHAAKNGHQVTLLEKNEKLGKKLFITGKGRCNITNACEIEGLFQNVISNPKFLYSSFYGFTNENVVELLEQEGCMTKVERGDRVFPVSDHSSDVIKALERILKKSGVVVKLQTEVKRLIIKENIITGVILRGGDEVKADDVILATGGLSYPITGSDGKGMEMAKECGHSVTDCVPSLIPLIIKEEWCKELQGLSLKNVSVRLETIPQTIFENKRKSKEIYSGFGEMLFTHFGVSGPLILSASSYLNKKRPFEACKLTLDLKPSLDEEKLDKRVLRDFEENNHKSFKNALGGLFPTKIIPVMISLSGIDPEQKVYEITGVQRKNFVHLIKNMEMTVTGTRGFEEAIITKGGISVKEVNPSTMESKICKNLYFAGEILDLDALTGGFNLQIAWSTGYLAGDLL